MGGRPQDAVPDEAMRRPGQVQPIGSVVVRVAAPALRKRGLTRAELLTDWPQIVGPYFAAHTSPVKLSYPRGRGDAGVLDLAAAPALATAIQHDAPRLTERINAWFGHRAVGRIRLVGAELPPAPPPPPPPVPRPPADVPAVAGLAAGPLRDALARLARHLDIPKRGTPL